ncbi:MAG: hypothetical protein V3V08_07975 [Nannocystaceae bacterium]
MESLAERYADKRVDSVMIYTREAHPGELHPHHASFADKLANAREMTRRMGFKRTMLVDNYEGASHRAYGQLPNMTYIVGRRGRIVYRASWTDARSIEWMLEQLSFNELNSRAGRRILPYFMEAELGKVADRKPFLEGLRTYAGMRAIDEYIDAVTQVYGEGTAKPLRKWREQAS